MATSVQTGPQKRLLSPFKAIAGSALVFMGPTASLMRDFGSAGRWGLAARRALGGCFGRAGGWSATAGCWRWRGDLGFRWGLGGGGVVLLAAVAGRLFVCLLRVTIIQVFFVTRYDKATSNRRGLLAGLRQWLR